MTKGPQIPKGIAQQLQVMQEKLLAAQDELAKETVTAAAGGGAVKITLTGDQRATEILINPNVLEDGDVEMLQDLILAALNSALEDSRNLAADRLSPFTPKLGL